MVTQHPTMQALFRYVEAIARSPQPVLITGETGTGKELLARAVHRLAAPRGDFVAVNVAGLDDQVFSDTLFGHTRGAFTGADRPREGLITRAEDGTLFLDEIGDLAATSQVKLLRLLQEGTYYPLGADRPRQSRARVVVATNRDVVQDMQAGTFRKDLYYRLRAHHVQIPPLRARRDDLPLLVTRSLAKAAAALHKPVPTPPLALYQLLNTYAFPGNIRELEAMAFDAVARHQGGNLALQAFKDAMEAGRRLLAETPGATPVPPSQGAWDAESLPTLQEAENALIAAALRHADGNQGVAARLLGLSRQALNKRLRRRQFLPGLSPA
jgi:DNA-binding NtrC family response regulator